MIFSMTGVNCLHGAHHAAQKSTTTGTDFDASTTSALNDAVVEILDYVRGTGLARRGFLRSKIHWLNLLAADTLCGGSSMTRFMAGRANEPQKVVTRNVGRCCVFERVTVHAGLGH